MSEQRPTDDTEGRGKIHGAVEPAGDDDTEGNLRLTPEQLTEGTSPAQAREEAARQMRERDTPTK